MQYLTGIHALNIEDNTEDYGDWHTSALNWKNIQLVDSTNTILKDYGIETNKRIPEHDELYNVANTLREILDLMIEGKTKYLKGFRNDFLCTDRYNTEFFEKVIQLKQLSNWEDINCLMRTEFMSSWDIFLLEKGINNNKKSKKEEKRKEDDKLLN